jgi:methyltransferase-like protein
VLLEGVPAEPAAYRGLLEEEQERLAQVRDTYIYHEHLEETNAPEYFHQFIVRAGRARLQFLSEADLGASLDTRLPPQVAAALRQLAGEPLSREQYLDFLTNRPFRQSLLCHADLPLSIEPEPDGLRALHLAATAECTGAEVEMRSTQPQEFRGPRGVKFAIGHPITKAAMLCLKEVWPRSIPFATLEAAARARLVGDAVVTQTADEYARDTRMLAENLLQGFAGGVVDLHAHPAYLVTEPGERPLAPAFVRRQATEGLWITNAWHDLVNLDPLTCFLLRHLDGQRDRAELVEVLIRGVAEQKIALERHNRPVTDIDRVRGILKRELDANLRRLGSCALLTA